MGRRKGGADNLISSLAGSGGALSTPAIAFVSAVPRGGSAFSQAIGAPCWRRCHACSTRHTEEESRAGARMPPTQGVRWSALPRHWLGTAAMRALGRPLGLVARRPGTLLRHRLLPPCGLARCCSSATTGAVPTRADPALISSSTAPGPIVVDSASGVVPGRPVVVADSAAGATPAAGIRLASRQNRASRVRR